MNFDVDLNLGLMESVCTAETSYLEPLTSFVSYLWNVMSRRNWILKWSQEE